MKVLFVVNDLSGTNGWSTYARNIIDPLLAHGHSVAVLVETITPQYHPEIQYAVLKKRPQAFVWNPFAIFQLAIRMRKLVRSIQPDAIHVIAEPYLHGLIFVPASRIVLTVHGTFAALPQTVPWGYRRFLSSIFYHYALRRVQSIIAVSEATRRRIVAHVASLRNRITVIHNAVEPAAIEAKRNPNPPGTDFAIATVGAVKRRKGIREAIEFFSEWSAERKKKVVYHVVGDCDETLTYVAEVKAYANARTSEYFSVVFHGRASEEQKADVLRHASLYVHLERMLEGVHDAEGFGIGIIEAASYGVPALVAKRSATEEAVKEGVSGFAVDLALRDEVYAKIDSLLIRGVCSADDCRTWAREHSPERMYESVVKLYRQ